MGTRRDANQSKSVFMLPSVANEASTDGTGTSETMQKHRNHGW